MAVRIGATRLIDNFILPEPSAVSGQPSAGADGPADR
jgi:hypothetical protein